jgi:DNA repair protein RadC
MQGAFIRHSAVITNRQPFQPLSMPSIGKSVKKISNYNLLRGVGVLIHNQPSGDLRPSHADVQMTQQTAAVASTLGVSVHDHIVVGREGHASLKGLKLI